MKKNARRENEGGAIFADRRASWAVVRRISRCDALHDAVRDAECEPFIVAAVFDPFCPPILRSRCMAVGAPAAISGSGAFSSLKEIDMGDMQ
ncbi:hypothetical protein [Burkholderia ubonensis]|uniref:hypothetical protein n=1 Tax=Burkholderia ubonensis TaxID=101571 RepID=UPI000AFE513C|nr:hypothetical protein [Burkholderia ubonensis]